MHNGDVNVGMSYGELLTVKVALEQSMARMRDPDGPLWRIQERALAKIEEALYPRTAEAKAKEPPDLGQQAMSREPLPDDLQRSVDASDARR